MRRTRSEPAIDVAGEALVPLASGAAWWPATRTLIVADLHFEKGSSFARRGTLLPPHDTLATLGRLGGDIGARDPARVISLGDAFHDPFGPERMDEATLARLSELQRGREWIWVSGNHDRAMAAAPGGETVEELAIGALLLRHEPRRGEARGEIAGHLHPAARVRIATGTARRHCFASDGQRLILPAYGAYAGGLDIASRAFAGLFDETRLVVHLLGEGCVHRFESAAIVGRGLNPAGTGRHRANR